MFEPLLALLTWGYVAGGVVASRRMVGIEHAILGGDQSEGVSSLTGASSLSTTR